MPNRLMTSITDKTAIGTKSFKMSDEIKLAVLY